MAVLPIYNCFHPVLKQKTAEVKEFNQEISDLIKDMYDTMYYSDNGIGLAANQVGKSLSIIVTDIQSTESSMKKSPLTLINPVIEAFSDEEWEYQEGCLSVPSLYENLDRPKTIQVRFLDADMKEQKIEADELLSRVIQHEMDHLSGILFFERLSALKRTLIKNKLKKIQKGAVDFSYPMVMPDGKLVKP